jgi:two-component system sensor histidine kinase MprB
LYENTPGNTSIPLDDAAIPLGEQMLRDVAVQLEEMSSLVTGLVELAADAPPDMEHTEIRLDELTEEAVTRARRLAPQLAFRTDRRPTTIRGVSTRVQRAIVNVLDNAVKWSPPGGAVDVAAANGAVAIRDRGPGIAQDDLPHVFDHFYRAAAARSLPGSGLGLSIVRQVVQQHDGSASIEPAEGGGTVVRLAFPVVSNGGGAGGGWVRAGQYGDSSDRRVAPHPLQG